MVIVFQNQTYDNVQFFNPDMRLLVCMFAWQDPHQHRSSSSRCVLSQSSCLRSCWCNANNHRQAALSRVHTKSGGAAKSTYRRASIQSQRIDAFQALVAWNASMRWLRRLAAFGVNAALAWLANHYVGIELRNHTLASDDWTSALRALRLRVVCGVLLQTLDY